MNIRKLADRLEDGADLAEPFHLREYNGNTLGEAVAEDEPEEGPA